jgi:hypothetical protein
MQAAHTNVTARSAPAVATIQGTALTQRSYVTADPLLHLLRRATYGPTPASEAELRSMGRTAWLEWQLRPYLINDAACDAVVARLPLQALDITGVWTGVDAGTIVPFHWDVMHQLGFATMVRAAWSRRQLFEVVVDFWSNHLNVTSPSDDVWNSRQDYDRMVIRKYAFGRFSDMLKASARHPAMLSYLDNRSSTKVKPNENYARELMELHTIGLTYTEADVRDASRLLTGLTVESRTGLYRYEPNDHATGSVSVAGFTHANATADGGEAAVLALLDYLAMRPATATQIARKLCVRFISDDPPPTLVTRLAQVYLDNHSSMVPVLRALFNSVEFDTSLGQKVRTPLEDVVATVRVLGLGPDPIDPVSNPTGTAGLSQLYWMARKAGHGPMRWPTPDGYPDVADAWAAPSSWLARWNTHFNLAAGWYPKELARPASLLQYLVPVLPATHGGLVDAVSLRLLNRTLPFAHADALLAFLGKRATEPLTVNDYAARWMFPYLVALILDSPYFSVR